MTTVKNSVDTSKCLVELRNIKKSFGGVQAVDDVSMTLYPGEVVAVLGHNGAGKSTLMKIMAGMDTEFTGEAWPGEHIRVGYLAQEPELDPNKTVKENVMDGDNLDSVANLFLGRELLTKWRTLGRPPHGCGSTQSVPPFE